MSRDRKKITRGDWRIKTEAPVTAFVLDASDPSLAYVATNDGELRAHRKGKNKTHAVRLAQGLGGEVFDIAQDSERLLAIAREKITRVSKTGRNPVVIPIPSGSIVRGACFGVGDTVVVAREEESEIKGTVVGVRVFPSSKNLSVLPPLLFECHGEAKFAWSASGRRFAVAQPRKETGANRVLRMRNKKPKTWECSVFNAKCEMIGVVIETEGEPKIALSVDGVSLAVYEEKRSRLSVWRSEISTEYLKTTCKQCETEDTEGRSFDEYCTDAIDLNPLRRIPPLYKTPVTGGGDDTCFNTDISSKSRKHPVTKHPVTYTPYKVERLDPPLTTSRLHREVEELNIGPGVRSMIVCGKGHGAASVVMALDPVDGGARTVRVVDIPEGAFVSDE